MSSYPLPIEVRDFRFMIAKTTPGHAVLEFDTPTNLLRVFLSQELIKRLATEAGITNAKLGSQMRLSGHEPE